jgi:hypothetical protein
MIQLSNKYYIGADKYNWILYKQVINKKTNEAEMVATKFYPTLESLLTNCLEMNMRELCMDKKSLSSLVISMSNERKKFSKQARIVCEGIKKEDLYVQSNNTNEIAKP